MFETSTLMKYVSNTIQNIICEQAFVLLFRSLNYFYLSDRFDSFLIRQEVDFVGEET